MKRSPALFFVWTTWVCVFLVVEGVAIWHEYRSHGNDAWTLTHYIASHMPISLRVAVLAWLVYHFLVQHIRS